VLTLVDISQEKKSAQEAITFKAAQEVAESLVNTVREPLIVLDGDLRVVSANDAFYNTFQVVKENTQKQLIYDIGNRQWDIPKLRELLEDILPKNSYFNDYEVDHNFPIIGHKKMLLNARQVVAVNWQKPMILLAIEDITKRK
jgi:two-component system CheB/CheR fusion protein